MGEIGAGEGGGEQAEDSLNSFLAALQAENSAAATGTGAGTGNGGNNVGGLNLGATSTASMKDLLAAWGAGTLAFEASPPTRASTPALVAVLV